MAAEGSPKCFSHETRTHVCVVFLWCTQTSSWMIQMTEATMTSSRKRTDGTETGFWESSDHILHIQLFSENILEDIQIFGYS